MRDRSPQKIPTTQIPEAGLANTEGCKRMLTEDFTVNLTKFFRCLG